MLHDLHFNLVDLLIEYFQILHIIPDSKIKDGSQCNKNGGGKVECVSERRRKGLRIRDSPIYRVRLPHGLRIVEPTIAFVGTRFTPHKAHAIKDPAKEYRSRNEGKHGAEHHAESHGGSFVLLRYAANGDKEIGRSACGADELEETHDRQKADKLGPTVDGTSAWSCLT